MKIRLLSNSLCVSHHPNTRANQQLGNSIFMRLVASPHDNQRILAYFIVGLQSILIARTIQIASLNFSFSEQHRYLRSESQEYTVTPPRCESLPSIHFWTWTATVEDISKTTAWAQAPHASYTAKDDPWKHAATGWVHRLKMM